jgi:surface-anchored protein
MPEIISPFHLNRFQLNRKNHMKIPRQWIAMSAFFAGLSSIHAQTVISSGHVDIGIAYENGEWDLHIHDETIDQEYEPDAATLTVKSVAETTVPGDARFAFLGESGTPIWVLPQVEDENLLFLGIAAEEIEDGVFVGDQVRMTLKSVSGPGHFFVYSTGGAGGDPEVRMNSRDGISDTNDFAVVLAGGHSDYNWAFTAPGVYQIGFQASGTLVAGNQAISSGAVTYTFEVMAPETRHLLVANLFGNSIRQYSAAGIDQGDFATEGLDQPGAVAVDAQGNVFVSTYGDSTVRKFSRQGEPMGIFASEGLDLPLGMAFDSGGNLYVANYASHNIRKFSPTGQSLGIFASTGLDGPAGVAIDSAGNFYVANSLGNTIRKFSPTGTDLGNVATNELFAPVGLAFDASGNLYVSNSRTNLAGYHTIRKYSTEGVDLGNFITNNVRGPTGMAFDSTSDLLVANAGGGNVVRFGPDGSFKGEFAGGLDFPYLIAFADMPNLIQTEHADIGAGFEDEQFDLHVHDETHDVEYTPDDVIIRVGTAARTIIPESAAFRFLGPAGGPIWIVPQIQDERLPFLGFATEEIEDGIFTNDEVKFSLESFSGPGQFIVYSVVGLGTPVVHINTADGVSATNDFRVLPTGGHQDLNWAFTAPGLYHVRISAEGTLINGNRLIKSEPVEYTFLVANAPVPSSVLASLTLNTDQSATVTLSGESNHTYEVQVSTNLTTWTRVTDVTLTTSQATAAIPAVPGTNYRFFRAVLK